MIALFLKLLNMSIVASWIILALLILRPMLKKVPKWIVCLMWAIVGIRLLVPISFESMFSLLPTAEPIPEDILEQSQIKEHVSKEQGDTFFVGEENGPSYIVSWDEIEGELSFSETSRVPSDVLGTNSKSEDVSVRLLSFASVVWFLGIAGMAVYALYSYLRIYYRVRSSVLVDKRVYMGDEINTPFILGLIRPRIYVPSAINENELKHVLLHKRAHLARLDHIWKPLGYAVLAVYWFNPLIWLAYYLLCKDIEFACDERVIKKLDASDKIIYTTTLLRCSVPRKMISACPLAFGEVRVKERIKTVLFYKKPTFWIIIIAVIACIVFSVAFLTNPKEKNFDQSSIEESSDNEINHNSDLVESSAIEENSKPEGISGAEESSEPEGNSNGEISEDSEFDESSDIEESFEPEESSQPDDTSESEESSEPEESSQPEDPIPEPPNGEVECVFNSFEVLLFSNLDQFVAAIETAGCTYTSQVESGYPIVKFENYQQFSVFAKTLQDGCSQSYVSYFDLGDTLERYNEHYFKNNDLVIVYTGESSGGNRNHLQSVLRNGKTLSITFLKTMGMTDDSIELFNCLEFSKKEIAYCNNFVLDITMCTIDRPNVKKSQIAPMTDTELESYLEYLNKELKTETFLLCLDTVDDVSNLINILGKESEFAKKLAVYDSKFFDNNSLYLFYSHEATGIDTLKISDETSAYFYYDYDYTVLRRELQIKIDHCKTASDGEKISQILMFGLSRQDYDEVSYSITVVE